MGEPSSAAGFRHGDIGYASLWVPDVERAATFFAAVLGWQYVPGSGPATRQVIGLSFHHGLHGGVEPSTLFCCYAVADLEVARDRVVAAGGTVEEAHAEPFGLVASGVDDQGVAFALFQPPDGVTTGADGSPNGNRPGDLAYVTMEVVDAARARAFYGAVLGWRATPGNSPDGWQVNDIVPMIGISGGHDRATTVPLYRVSDVAAAVDAVRAAGGTATDPDPQPYGVTSTCTDDQGTRFYLGELTP